MFRKVLFHLYLGIFDPFSAYSHRNHVFYSFNKKYVHTFQEYILTINHVQSTYCLIAKPDLSLLRPPELKVACQAPLSMGFPRQEYWNGVPFPSPGDLLNPGIEPASPAFPGRFSTAEPRGKSLQTNTGNKYMVMKNRSFHNPVMVQDGVQI